MKKIICKLETPLWLFLLLFVVLILRIPSFFEPYSYGDEMIYLTLGNAIRKGVSLYSQIHDNKPPLLYLVAAAAENLFWFRAILAIWHMLTVFIFWKLVSFLYSKNNRLQIVATSVFAISTTIPLLEGNIPNAEMFMIGTTILSFYILLAKKTTILNLIFAGFLLSLSSLFKMPAVFEIPVILLFWLTTVKKLSVQKIKSFIVNFIFIMLGFAIPILLTFIWYYINGSFSQYLSAAYLQNFGYLSSWRPDDSESSFFVKNGPLLIRSFITLFLFLFIFFKRNLLPSQFKFASLWLFLTLFAVTLSERPYPHYLIQSMPAVALLAGMLFCAKGIEQVLSITSLTIFLFVPIYYKYWHYPTISYYKRFVNFSLGKMDKDTYFSSFGGDVLTKYKIAKYLNISSKPQENIFVLGDTSTIYALTRKLPPIKYVADYHINDFSSYEEVAYIIENNLPSHIIILPKEKIPQEIRSVIKKYYYFIYNIDGATIWKLHPTAN